MSRSTAIIFVLAAGCGLPAHAQDVTAEEALERYRKTFAPADRAACNQVVEGDEILVCGRRGRDPYRLPLPVEPMPGERVAGEPPAQLAASRDGSERCSTVGPHSSCAGFIPILPFAAWVVDSVIKGVKASKED